jgi:hypothetical protein
MRGNKCTVMMIVSCLVICTTVLQTVVLQTELSCVMRNGSKEWLLNSGFHGQQGKTLIAEAFIQPSCTGLPWHNQWPIHVRAVRGEDLDLSALPSVPIAFSGSKPATVISPGRQAHMESWQLLLTRRLLKSRSQFVNNESFVLIDVGCNSGTYTNYWSTLGFHSYCVDAEVFGGPSGVGMYDFAALKNAPSISQRITFFPVGLSSSATKYLSHMGGHNFLPAKDLNQVQGIAIPTVSYADLMGKLQSSFLTKIDIDGGEICALESILKLIDNGGRMSNIIVELTPMWWQRYDYSFEKAWAIIERVLSTHDVYVVFWREASQVCCKDIFATPPALDWDDNSTLSFVQKIDPKAFNGFLAQMLPAGRKHGQRDFWFRERDQHSLHGLEDGVHLRSLRCSDISLYADAFKADMPCGRHH